MQQLLFSLWKPLTQGNTFCAATPYPAQLCTVQVESLQSVVRDRRANWKQSMAALKLAKQSGARVTKTSIMLGCGEQPDEVLHAFRTLRENGMSALASAAVSVPAVFPNLNCDPQHVTSIWHIWLTTAHVCTSTG